MKIVFLSPAAERGGAESVLIEMIKALREAKPAWSLHLIAGEDGPLLKKVQALNITAEVLPFPKAIQRFGETRREKNLAVRARRAVNFAAGALASLRYQLRLRRALASLRPDIVHSNGMKMHFLASLALRKSARRIPLIWHLHDYLSTRKTMAPLLRRASRCCDLVISNSQSVGIDARQVLPPSLPVHVIYNTVDPEVFAPQGARLNLDELCGRPLAPEPIIRVGLVATFALWKGHETFLRSIAALRTNEKCDHSRFYIVGGPLYATSESQYQQSELTDAAKALGIDDIVGFTGVVDDVPSAMRALDIVVHASTEPEPFGLVIIQAMACGRPVISSGLGGASELIRPDLDGVTFPAGSSEALAAAIDRLANDAQLRARLGRVGREKIQRDFSRDEIARRLLPVYEKLRIA